jgi:hypothetical protein
MNWRSMTILRPDVHREVHGDNFEDSNSRSKDEAFELNGYVQRSLSRFPESAAVRCTLYYSSRQRRVSGMCFFGITSPLVGDKRAFLSRDVCGNKNTSRIES